MSHKTPTSGDVTDESPLYVVLGPLQTAMSFAHARGIDHHDVVPEGHAIHRLLGLARRVVLVTTHHAPVSRNARDIVRMQVEAVNHTIGVPTDEIAYR